MTRKWEEWKKVVKEAKAQKKAAEQKSTLNLYNSIRFYEIGWKFSYYYTKCIVCRCGTEADHCPEFDPWQDGPALIQYVEEFR